MGHMSPINLVVLLLPCFRSVKAILPIAVDNLLQLRWQGGFDLSRLGLIQLAFRNGLVDIAMSGLSQPLQIFFFAPALLVFYNLHQRLALLQGFNQGLRLQSQPLCSVYKDVSTVDMSRTARFVILFGSRFGGLAQGCLCLSCPCGKRKTHSQ